MPRMRSVFAFLMCALWFPAAQVAMAQSVPAGGDDMQPTWSPDGTQIAFVSNRDGNYGLYLMNADGSDTQKIAQGFRGIYSLSWSPDGQQMVFTSPGAGDGGDIHIANADGSGERNLTDSAEGDQAPLWSPDGQYIAFSSVRDNTIEDVYLMKSDGSDVHNLTQNDNPTNIYSYDWSPDGQHIAYLAEDIANESGTFFVADQNGDHSHSLTDPNPDTHPLCCRLVWTWQPNSQQITFVIPGSGNISAVNIQTGKQKILAFVGSGINNFDWTPNGERIFYSMNTDDPDQTDQHAGGIYSVNLADGEIQYLFPGELSGFFASHDKSRLAVLAPYRPENGPTDLILYTLGNPDSQVVDPGYYNLFGMDWSPDNRYLLASMCPEIESDSDIYLIDAETGQAQNLTPDDALADDATSSENFRAECRVMG